GFAFDHERLSDGDALDVGRIRLTVAHTPGHTPDSICLLVTDLERGTEPWFVLTGDTLFVGSVGRPDLGGARAAAEAYESLTRVRSEEHTSELQSRGHLVCRLLLEKKKITQ